MLLVVVFVGMIVDGVSSGCVFGVVGWLLR